MKSEKKTAISASAMYRTQDPARCLGEDLT